MEYGIIKLENITTEDQANEVLERMYQRCKRLMRYVHNTKDSKKMVRAYLLQFTQFRIFNDFRLIVEAETQKHYPQYPSGGVIDLATQLIQRTGEEVIITKTIAGKASTIQPLIDATLRQIEMSNIGKKAD